MAFEREQDVLDWYDGQERVITPDFLATIPWNKVKDHPIDEKFVPVLLYMRDIEKSTLIYEAELRRTPTAKNPIISRFLERWRTEEPVHGDLLNRFLSELGFPTSDDWFEKMKAKLPRSYEIKSRLTTTITNLVGRHFTAVHMTWGAIQELSTLSGYERLWRTANHPVLEYILRAIAREEARHSLFYWSIADLQLKDSPHRQRLARFLVNKFWTPVGQGIKPKKETDYLIGTLFAGADGLKVMHDRVNQRIAQLPGFVGLKTISDRVKDISLRFES